MALNNFGFGFTVSAKDAATPTLTTVGSAMGKLTSEAKASSEAMAKVAQQAKGATQALSAAAMKAAASAAAAKAASGAVPHAYYGADGKPRSSDGKFVRTGKRSGTIGMSAFEQSNAAAITAGNAPKLAPGNSTPALPGSDASKGAGGGKGDALFDLEKVREVRAALQDIKGVVDRLRDVLLGMFDQAANEATKFGRNVASVASITDRATFPMEKIAQIGKEMTALYGGDINTQVSTLYQAVSSGATNAAEATALLHAANKLAIGGMSDSFKAVDALTNVLNAYNMKMTEANVVSDALFVTAKIGKTTIDELAQQIGRVAPTASAMNVSLDDLMASITAGSTQLGNASAAIDGMKEALSAVLKPTKDASEEAKKLGIDFSMAGIKAAGGWNKFLMSILTNGKKSDETIKNLWGGSMTAFNLMSVLAAHNGKAFNEALAGMTDKAGATDYAFSSFAESADFAQTVLRGNLQTALVNIGEALLPVVGLGLQLVNKALKAFNTAPPFVHKLAAAFGVVVAVGATLLGGILGVSIAIAGLIAAGETLLVVLSGVGVAFALAALAAAPLILAATALYEVWDKNLGGIRDRVGVWYAQVKLAFDGISQLFSSGSLSGETMEKLGAKGAEGIKGFVVTVYMWGSRAINFFKSIWSAFEEGISIVGPVVGEIAQEFQHIVRALVPISETGSTAKASFKSFGDAGLTVGRALVRIVKFVADGVLGLISFIRGAVDVFSGFGPALSAAWDAAKALGSALSSVFSVLTGGNSTTASSAESWKAFGQFIGTVVSAGLYGLVFVLRTVAAVLEWVSGMINGVRVVFDGLATALVLGVSLIGALFTGNWQQVWTIAGQIVDNAINTIIQTMLKLVAGAAGAMDQLGKIFGKDLGLKASVEAFAKSDASKSNISPAPQLGPHTAPASSDTSKMVPKMAPLVPMAPAYPTVQTAPTLDKEMKGFGPELPKVATPADGSSPGVVAARAGGENPATAKALQDLAAKQDRPPPPVHVNVRTVLDGRVVAENTSEHQAQEAARGYVADAP